MGLATYSFYGNVEFITKQLFLKLSVNIIAFIIYHISLGSYRSLLKMKLERPIRLQLPCTSPFNQSMILRYYPSGHAHLYWTENQGWVIPYQITQNFWHFKPSPLGIWWNLFYLFIMISQHQI